MDKKSDKPQSEQSEVTPTTIAPIPSSSNSTRRQDARHSPYTPILSKSSDRNKSRKRRSISWQSEDKLLQIHHFELIADERVNVYRANNDQQNTIDTDNSPTLNDSNNKGVISNNPGGVNKFPSSSQYFDNGTSGQLSKNRNDSDSTTVDIFPWRPLISIDYDPEIPPPGWNSSERIAQAERESCVLGAIDLPGQPSTIDEPDQDYSSSHTTNPPSILRQKSDTADGNSSSLFIDSSHNLETLSAYQQQQQQTNSNTATTLKDDIIIPLSSDHGVYREYHDMYTTHEDLYYGNYQDLQTLINSALNRRLC